MAGKPDSERSSDGGTFTELVAGLDAIAADLDARPHESSAEQRRQQVVVLADAVGRVEAALAHAVRAMSREGDHGADGARSIGSWVAARTELSVGRANSVDRMARDLEDLPAVFAAWRAGVLGSAKVRMVLDVDPALREFLVRDQDELVDELGGKTVMGASRALGRWREAAMGELDRSPDDPPPAPEQPVNSVKLTAGIGTERHALAIFDALTGAEFAALLESEIDRAHRAGEFDRSDGKSLDERRADALMALLRRGAANPDGEASRAHVVVNIQIDLTWLFGIRPGTTADVLRRPCETADGALIPLDQVLGALDDATINLILGHLGLEGTRFRPVGEVTTRRLADASQRRLLRARDETCRWPGCDAPASWAKAHHEPPWQIVHETSVPQLVLLCPFHHRLRHDGGFRIRIDEDGEFHFHRPDRRPIADAPPGEKIVEPPVPPDRSEPPDPVAFGPVRDVDDLIAMRLGRHRWELFDSA